MKKFKSKEFWLLFIIVGIIYALITISLRIVANTAEQTILQVTALYVSRLVFILGIIAESILIYAELYD